MWVLVVREPTLRGDAVPSFVGPFGWTIDPFVAVFVWVVRKTLELPAAAAALLWGALREALAAALSALDFGDALDG